MLRHVSKKADELRERLGLSYEHLLGIRFAVNVAISTTIVWNTLVWIADTNPIWAIASMVAASDPQPTESMRIFWSRIINVLVGCAAGLSFLLIGGARTLILPFALGATVLITTYFVRIKTMWRQAPITAALVIAAGITSGSTQLGIVEGLHKVAEVLFGCVVGFGISWLMSMLWLIDIPKDRSAI